MSPYDPRCRCLRHDSVRSSPPLRRLPPERPLNVDLETVGIPQSEHHSGRIRSGIDRNAFHDHPRNPSSEGILPSGTGAGRSRLSRRIVPRVLHELGRFYGQRARRLNEPVLHLERLVPNIPICQTRAQTRRALTVHHGEHSLPGTPRPAWRQAFDKVSWLSKNSPNNSLEATNDLSLLRSRPNW